MKKLFKEQNVSLYKVEKDLGYAVNKLYRYKNPKKMPIKLMLDLAQYFKMTPNELLKKMEDYKGE